MSKYVLPVPFSMGPYGCDDSLVYKNILKVSGSSENYAQHFPNNLLIKNCQICEPVTFEIFPEDQPEIAKNLKTVSNLQDNLAQKIDEILPTSEGLVIIGGDHSISVGTGLGLAKNFNMSEVGLIWVDSHGDINTPETSQSKSITGFPVAINCGLGPKLLVDKFEGNFIQKVVQIGIRDLDEAESLIQKKYVTQNHSTFEIEEKGMGKVLQETLEALKDCKYLWLSIDIDSLDAIYFQKGETDLPVTGGLTPREILYLTQKIAQTGKLIVTEITQLKSIEKQTDLQVFASRVSELALGLGGFRYGI